MDRLRQMRSLVTVSQLRSFSEAAKQLGVTPGMMSKQIKALEAELGVRLLHRSTRGVSLTEPGELYVKHLIEILNKVDEANSALTDLAAAPKGILRISCPPSFGTHVLTPAISSFSAENPEIRVELGLQDDEPDVIASRLDVIFRLGDLRDSSLVARRFANAPFVLCATKRYVSINSAPKSTVDLSLHNCVVDASIQADSRWIFLQNKRRISYTVDGNFISHSTEAVIEAMRDSAGIAYVPRYAVSKDLDLGRIVALELEDAEPLSIPLYALSMSRKHISGKVGAFLSFCEEYINDRDDLQGQRVQQSRRSAREALSREPEIA